MEDYFPDIDIDNISATSFDDVDELNTSDVEIEVDEIKGGNIQQNKDMIQIIETLHNVKFIHRIDGDERESDDFLSLNEATEAIAIRADQIEKSPDSRNYIRKEDIELIQNLQAQQGVYFEIKIDSSLRIALIEFYSRRSPLVLLRQKGNQVERWLVRDMKHPQMNNLNIESMF